MDKKGELFHETVFFLLFILAVFTVIFFAEVSSAEGKGAGLWGRFASQQTNYGGSKIKDHALATKAYIRSSYGEIESWEFLASQSTLYYKGGDDLDQTDVTLAYNNKDDLISNFSLRGGGHYIDSDDALTDNGIVLFGRGIYIEKNAWDGGVEIDYSIYEDSITNLHVLQTTPSLGFYLTDNTSDGSLYTESKLYYIHKDKGEEEYVPISQHNFVSFEQGITYSDDPFDIKASAWVGEQFLAVKTDSFLVNNLRDRYDGGLNFEIGYMIEKRFRLGAVVSYDQIKHPEIDDDRASQTTLSLNIGGEL
ncbi:MAG: hypothetical protein V1753_11615 [Pseudomonadota bacterium]